MGRTASRDSDDRLLHLIALRCAGYSAAQTGARYGMADTAVRTMTNRVRDADVVESGEPREAVLAAYRWR